MPQKFYIETVGCQMNVLDSELAISELILHGYEQVRRRQDADIILFNTCSVREHAEEKIYSALGRLKHWKERRPNGILGVMGCMAQKDQKKIFRRAPHVDLVLGPGQLDRLPELLAGISAHHTAQIAVSLNRFGHEASAMEIRDSFRRYDPRRLPEARPSRFQAMVRIMFGCNKFCTYCIVPNVRGPEQSRPPQEIIQEIRKLADQGCVDVTLLGQTVNSYRYMDDSGETSLAQLLEQIDAIEGIRRIRFVSNYPTGMTNRLLEAVRDLPHVMPYLHVPAQHGADTMLKRMKRMYSVSEYRDLVDRIYDIIPGVAITSDFIVGFSGETEEEFQKTVELVRYCRFKNSFIFKYSVREGTRASQLYEDDIPEQVKKQRNNALLAVQNEISAAQNQTFVGKTVEILVEGRSKNDYRTDKPGDSSGFIPVSSLTNTFQLTGRTPDDRIVVFDGPESLIGTFQQLDIEAAAPFTLFGKLV
ncbi:MAG: tRNA (N6-isopentenyl adenosine(37)-C2)-methylthiotransferase MiaB [Thermoguttaceae bacterium]|nr:tRNA (N6-isopentenyl adenosine(37)-C2)-methylthiotransferase MiaB [Thermoguttaceae bacterium]